ncbi:MAG: chemotaxis-specific protein-glutamate methyltransferase CheB [Acidobacteria bacterium]|nr:chemotaxis-specific protein-glutamate methyltransferase CheB [Acidobacteriota bacterium]
MMDERPLRVLAADDSTVMRGIMRTLFLRHAKTERKDMPRMELVGVARDGAECLEAASRLSPDVLVLDLEMPRLSGLEVLDKLRESRVRLPVIMCSSHTERGARATLDALSRGASDYVMKPAGQRDFEASLASLAEQLLPRIAALAVDRSARASLLEKHTGRAQGRLPQTRKRSDEGGCGARVDVVVIGVSTGGPAALEQLLPQLSAALPVPVLIVQHMPKLFTGVLSERLDRCCSLNVAEAYHGAPLKAGAIWIAPGDEHMEIMSQPQIGWDGRIARGASIKLHRQEPLNHCRPSVDYLFHSAAHLYGAGTLGLVLTGMGSDGLEGSRSIRNAGGTVLAQDEATSAVWGMPGRVVEAGVAASPLPLHALAREVNIRAGYARSIATSVTEGSLRPRRQNEVVANGLF